MANHASSAKRIRQTAKRTKRNQHIRTTVRTYIKRVRDAVKTGNASAAQEALKVAVRRVDMAVSKGVYPRKTGSRYISRLTQAVAKLAA